MRNLLLTLGHNSSAVFVENGRVMWGLETERVTGRKSDSSFPKAVLDRIGQTSCKCDMVYVSHWAPNGMLDSMSSKHWQPKYFDGVPIRTLSLDRSHHDAHLHGAMCYAGRDFPKSGTFGLVIDGFGTFGEHLSVYYLGGDSPKLVRRVHGYDTSLGLWYQYATAFMGLKMHEDEYKLLGYETGVDRGLYERLQVDAANYAQVLRNWMDLSPYKSTYDPLYDLSALANVKDLVWNHLLRVAEDYDITDPTLSTSRTVLSHYVQAVLENVVLSIVEEFAPTNLLCSGGVFYNVKLNKLLVDKVPGVVCVYPLAGDQGNGIGLYAMDHPEFEFPDDLNWGPRLLKDVGKVPNLHVVDDEYNAHALLLRLIYEKGYANLVRGSTEFGPRAMCNTSTLALPTAKNVDRINRANERNGIMPMAPVVTKRMYHNLFKNAHKVWKSQEHMVVALEYQIGVSDIAGVAHRYRYPHEHWTGRPQVVGPEDSLMQGLLAEFGPLINTSFNFHGKPIAFDMDSIINNHLMQYKRDPYINTVVVNNG